MKNNTTEYIIKARSGCKDIWNAYMANNALFSVHDIPLCPTTATDIPKSIITWEEAKSIYKKSITKADNSFFITSYVCFYLDDYKFDSKNGIWSNPKQALKILRHFAGIITPDFSTYQDFPFPLKIYNTYRMRLFGYWIGQNGISVINNVRWGTEESWSYCFEGIPKNSIVSIGTLGGSPKKHIDRKRFENGLQKMIEVLQPHTIIVYGSSNYDCFNIIKAKGINVISFQSNTAKYWDGRKENE